MIGVKPSSGVWIDYLQVVREEVRDGVGIFREDEELRELLLECFDRGDTFNGFVAWEQRSREMPRIGSTLQFN